MVTVNPVSHLSGLAKRLVLDGLLAEELAAEAQETALKKREPFVSYLVDNKILAGSDIAASACQEFGTPLLDLASMELENLPISLVDEKLIRQHHALPLFKRGNRLFVAVSDPTNLQALDEIKFHTGISTEAILVEEDKLGKAIDKALDSADTSMTDLLDEDLDNLDISNGDDDNRKDDSMDADIDDTPVVRFVNKVLLDAINKGASDIHIEPYEKSFRIRFRQDGVLLEVASPPQTMANRLVARIKVMSRMDIAERRVPQDGRIKMALSKKRARAVTHYLVKMGVAESRLKAVGLGETNFIASNPKRCVNFLQPVCGGGVISMMASPICNCVPAGALSSLRSKST